MILSVRHTYHTVSQKAQSNSNEIVFDLNRDRESEEKKNKIMAFGTHKPEIGDKSTEKRIK